MSSTISSKPHLWVDNLSDEADRERRALADWASTVQFKDKADDFQIHESDEFQKRITPLLRTLQLPYKGYSLVQIPGPTPAPFLHTRGDAYIIPLKLLSGQPNVSTVPLQEGKSVLMKCNQGVIISPELRLLFILL